MKPDTPSGRFSLDSGVLIEMLLATPLGQVVVEGLISDSIIAHTTYLNLCEAEYIICRRHNREVARSKVENLVNSNYLTMTEMESLSALAAEIKCERAMALADCFCLANAKLTNSKALFAFKEEDLTREITRKPFDVEVEFLEDMASSTNPADPYPSRERPTSDLAGAF